MPAEALTPAKQAGTRFTYPRRMKGWVNVDGWLHVKVIYLSTESHPSNHLITKSNLLPFDHKSHILNVTSTSHAQKQKQQFKVPFPVPEKIATSCSPLPPFQTHNAANVKYIV